MCMGESDIDVSSAVVHFSSSSDNRQADADFLFLCNSWSFLDVFRNSALLDPSRLG